MPSPGVAPTAALALVLLFPGAIHAQEPQPTPLGDDFMVTLQVGAGSLRGWNFASVAVEMFPGDQEKVGVFAVAGLGTILAGAGVAYYGNRDGTGLTAAAVGGLAGGHVQLGGQVDLGEWGFLTGGLSYGSYFLQHHGVLPYLGWEYRM